MESTAQFRWLFILEGIVFCILGSVMILSPFAASLAVEFIVGTIVIVGSVFQILQAFQAPQNNLLWSLFLAGLVNLFCGLFLAFYPFFGLKALTFLLTAYLLIKAVLDLMLALILRDFTISWWLFANSAIFILLVTFIWQEWPLSSYVFIGVMAGVNFIASGITYFMLGIKNESEILRLRKKISEAENSDWIGNVR